MWRLTFLILFLDGEVMTSLVMPSLVGDTDGADGAPLSIEMSWAGAVAGDAGTVDGDWTFAMGSSPCN